MMWIDEQDLITKFGVWGEHRDYPVADWKYEMANDDTRSGYWEWVANRIMNEED